MRCESSLLFVDVVVDDDLDDDDLMMLFLDVCVIFM